MMCGVIAGWGSAAAEAAGTHCIAMSRNAPAAVVGALRLVAMV